jgi:hypothetical protein
MVFSLNSPPATCAPVQHSPPIKSGSRSAANFTFRSTCALETSTAQVGRKEELPASQVWEPLRGRLCTGARVG